MKYFEHNGETYHLTHHLSDDSRTVILLENQEDQSKYLLRFTSSLDIQDNKKKSLGRMSITDPQNIFCYDPYQGEQFVTGIHYRQWHWVAILEAEIAIAKYLIDKMEVK
jgi:hypothetical protein